MMPLFRDKTFLVVMLLSVLALMSVIVTGDQCNQMCGLVQPFTAEQALRACPQTGDTQTLPDNQIYWSDGSNSVYTIDCVTQLVIGSCCSKISWTDYCTGIVTAGRFANQTIVRVRQYHDHRQAMTCNECQTSSGLSGVSGPQLLSIGTKGVGQWIECTGNGTYAFSPALTGSSQLVYSTLSLYFNDCSDCVESC